MEASVITHPATSHASAEEASQPIANYGLLADCNSAALVDRDGSIDWLCLPRYDSDAIFSRLLDPDAGHWSIRPTRAYAAERRYLPGTLVVETTFFTGEEGTFVICSFWLVSCLAKAGELERAEALLEQLAGYANDLGLLAEEIDKAREVRT
jgi:GH15 family glucan-1,4-alpha-glucosidase